MTESTPKSAIPTAEELRLFHLNKQLEEAESRAQLLDAERRERERLAEEFLKGDVSQQERDLIRILVRKAVEKGEDEVMIYSFPSKLCTDEGRAINSADPDWPETLQGKARVLYDRFKEDLQPRGYRMKAMIINFPDGMPGDVGFFLDWSPKET
jgi:hypothetical protein